MSNQLVMRFNDTPIRNRFIFISLVSLIVATAISGCSSDNSEGQIQQGKDTSHTNAIHKEVGEATWYGPGFQGKETANGEAFNQAQMTAAHPTLPMGTEAKVTNLENGKKVEVRINDRGPYAEHRVIDLSSAAAKKLNMKADGTTQVKIETKSTQKKISNTRPSRINKTKKRHK